jgi:predicted N-acyltransferase
VALYQQTGSRKWGRAFDAPFSNRSARRWAPSCSHAEWTANCRGYFIGAETLYGRYWGALEDRPFLHFELSYYRAIDWVIAHGFRAIQAGAQGEHKLARGYEPVVTPSVHFLPDAGFRRAVANFLEGEREAVRLELEWARGALPYRSDSSS